MKIFEIESAPVDPSMEKLAALSRVLLGRASDTNAKKQISQNAFINLAQSLGVNLNKSNLSQAASQPPLSNIIEPIDPTTNVITFKSEENQHDIPWSPDDVGADMGGDPMGPQDDTNVDVGAAMTGGQETGDVPMPDVNSSEQIVKQNAQQALKRSTGSKYS